MEIGVVCDDAHLTYGLVYHVKGLYNEPIVKVTVDLLTISFFSSLTPSHELVWQPLCRYKDVFNPPNWGVRLNFRPLVWFEETNTKK